MALEIEIKAWIRRPEVTRRLIEERCVFRKNYLKEDIYFSAPEGSAFAGGKAAGKTGEPDLRIRSENGEWICTHKEKTIRNGLEVNEENEFTLSDGPLLGRLLEKLGCRENLRKVKQGKSYSCRGLNVEVSDVRGLGLFVEAEKVLEQAAPEDLDRWEKTIREFLAEIGVRDEDIESRPYSLMLREHKPQ
jgi:adenylate cyclase class 2